MSIRCQVRDIVTLGKAKKGRDGFIEADAVFSRTGCQDYTRRELGLDGDQSEVVTLYRPAEEVFAPESLASLDGKPLTLHHPPEDVNADNWKLYGVGDAHNIRRSGETTTGKVIIRDGDAVRAYESGTRELSVGYAFDLDMTPGTAPDGKKYQGIQRNIRGNHHAIVDEGRCGGECRVGDGKNHGRDTMPTMRKIKTDDAQITDAKGAIVKVPGLDIELDVSTPEGAKAADAVDRFTRGMKDCMAAHDSVKAEVALHKERGDAAEKRLSELDAMPDEDDDDEEGEEGAKKGKDAKTKLGDRVLAYLARLQGKAKTAASDAVVETRAAERQAVVDGAIRILGSDFKAKDKSTKDVRIAALTAVMAKDGALKAVAKAALGGAELTKADDKQLATAFETVIAAIGDGGSNQRVTDAELDVGRAFVGSGGAGNGNDVKPTLIGRDHLMNKMFGQAEAAS